MNTHERPSHDRAGTAVLFLRTDSCTVEPRIQKESASLARAGYRVLAFGWDRKGEYPRKEVLHGVCFSRSRIPGPYGSKLLALILPFFWLRAFVEILRFRPALLHACDLDGLVPALAAKPFIHCSILYDIFDIFSEKITNLPPGVRRLLDRIDRRFMRGADAVIVTDEHRRRLIADVPLRRVEVIMNVPPPFQGMVPPRLDTLFRVAYTGNIHEHRGLVLIGEALRELEGTEAVFAGWITRREDEEYLKQQPQIRFLGKLPYQESMALVAGSDVSLALYDPALPINALASSNKVFEAMALARPVITNRETTMAPIVEAEECGLLVPYGDVPALRAALQRLRDDAALRERLGRNGAEAFRRQYNWDAMEKRLLRLYEDLCPGGASPGTSPGTRDRESVTAHHTGHRGETRE